MDEPKKPRPRPEAQPFDIKNLSKSQKKAMIAIIEKITQASLAVSRKKNKKALNPGIIEMEDDRPNRIVLLSGGRGSGKTSVLYTLIKAFSEMDDYSYNDHHHHHHEHKHEEHDDHKHGKDDDHKHGKDDEHVQADNTSNFWNRSESGKRIHRMIRERELHKRVVWLQTLDMETLPRPTNLLAAIFSRINEAVDRFREFEDDQKHGVSGRFRFDMYPDGQDTMLEFAKLQQDVALAWNGNLEQRAASVDPDVYAVEVLRTEHSRFKLNKRLSSIIDSIAQKFLLPDGRRSIFILPVDDFDMNPDRCLELIRLLRMISVPRLFTVILGDQRIIRDVVNINVVATLATVRGDNARITVPGKIPYDECRIGHEISANAIRKMFPESHTIKLEPMGWKEVFEHKPKGEDESIGHFLMKVPVKINTGYQLPAPENSSRTANNNHCCLIGGVVVENIRDMFNIRVKDIISFSEEKRSEDEEDEIVYLAPAYFKMHSRHFQDVWRCLQRDTGDERKKGRLKIGIDLAYNFFKQMVREARHLTMSTSHCLSAMAKEDFRGKAELDTTHMDFIYTYGPPGSVFRQKETKTKCSIGINLPKTWAIKLKRSLWAQTPGEGKGEYILHDTTSAALIFLHDLLAFSHPGKLIGTRLQKLKTVPHWAYSQWHIGHKREGIRVVWPFPPWLTMFECDLLRRSWIQVWRWFEEVKKEFSIDKSSRIDKLLEQHIPYAWITIITRILAGPKVYQDIFIKLYPEEKDLDNLNNEIKKIMTKQLTGEGKMLQERIGNLLNGGYQIGTKLAPDALIMLVDSLKKLFRKEKQELFPKDQFGETYRLIEVCKLFRLHSPHGFRNLVKKSAAIKQKYEKKVMDALPEEVKDAKTVTKTLDDIKKHFPEKWFNITKSDRSRQDVNLITELDELLTKADDQLSKTAQNPPGEHFDKVKEIIEDINKKLASGNEIQHGWESLLNQIVILINDDTDQYERRRRVIRGWLAGIACIFAPESGLETIDEIKELLRDKNDSPYRKIKEQWGRPDIAHDIRLIRAHSAVKFFNVGAIKLLFELFSPQTQDMLCPTSPEAPPKKDGKAPINTVHNGSLCPVIEDIVALSEIEKNKVRKYSAELMKLIRGR